MCSDCPNRDAAVEFWKAEFLNFDSRYWSHTFRITHQKGYEENFSFVHKGTLFISLNIPGGEFESFWTKRLKAQLNWTKRLATSFVNKNAPRIGRIVLFAHAWPNDDHKRLFFNPLAAFIEEVLNNETPFLFVHGDGHQWLSNPGYLGQSSLLEIMVKGGTSELPLKVNVDANGQTALVSDSFKYVRVY